MILFTNIEFFDGETIEDNYVLLGNSKDYIYNPKGLSFIQALNFLFETGKEFNYFFRMDYDINQLTKNIENDLIEKLFKSEKIKYENYEIQYFRHKIFIIKKNNIEKVFYDVFNFFNTSFINVMQILDLDKEFPKEFEIIKKMKKVRNVFNNKILNKIINYNKLECRIGIEIVKKIYDLLPNNLKTLKLYGSSSITNIYLKQNEIDKKIKEVNFFELKNMYYGGRIEIFKCGYFENIYKYDINSAYPFVIKDLRVLKEIKKSKNKNEIVETDIYKIKMKINDKELIGLLPIRLKNGLIVFPDEVEGYYYGVEVQAVFNYSKKYNIDFEIIERYECVLGEKLFNDIEKIYNLRLKYKKVGDKRNLIYKILLNSIYGKFAQKVGNNIFCNYYYAGFITAKIRSKLLNDFIDYAKDIISISTDGILTINENNKLKNKINDKIGNYELIKIKKGYVILAGIYYLIDYNGKIYKGQRGFHIDYKSIIPLINETGKAIIYDNVFLSNLYCIKNYKKYGNKKSKIIRISKTLNIFNQIKRNFIFNIDTGFLETQFNSFLLNKKQIKKIDTMQVLYLQDFFDFNIFE